MGEVLARYPKGRMSQGSGDLLDVFDVSQGWEDGRKLMSTLRANPAGWTDGSRVDTMTFKSGISQYGFERDWLKKWEKGEEVELRFKVPGKTLTMVGPLTKPKITSNRDNWIEFEISCIGKCTAE